MERNGRRIPITADMTFGSVEQIPLIEEAGPYMIAGPGQYHDQVQDLPLREGTVLGWNHESMIEGLEYLMDRAEQGTYLYRVYSQEVWAEEPDLRDVNIIHFPAQDREKAKKHPWIMACPGGAYINVCSISEGYPVAKRFNALGYDVFVATYRTGLHEVMPKPLDDLAECIRYVQSREAEFALGDPDRYIVCGFSAGGNLTALWGTKNHGYEAYHLPKPEALFPIYPVSDLHLFPGIDQEIIDTFLRTMFGGDTSEEKQAEYSVLAQADEDYPPSFIACCRDDATVPCVNSEKLYERLQELGVASVLEMGERGGHGFGDGRFSDVKDWMEHAAAFAEETAEREEAAGIRK